MRNYVCATFLVSSLILLAAPSAVAQDPAGMNPADPTAIIPGLTQDERNTLTGETGGPVTRFFKKRESPSLVPESDLAAEIRRICTALEPDYGIETVMVTRMPDRLTRDGNKMLSMYEVLLSVSTMEGIRYFSESRNAEHTLFERSYRISGPDNRTKLPDPVPSMIPDDRTVCMLQKDTTFGENLYEADYRATETGLMLGMENLTPLKLAFFTVVEARNLRIILLVVPSGEHLVFYGVSVARSGFSLFEDRVKLSFQNRLEALIRWFTMRLETSGGR